MVAKAKTRSTATEYDCDLSALLITSRLDRAGFTRTSTGLGFQERLHVQSHLKAYIQNSTRFLTLKFSNHPLIPTFPRYMAEKAQ